MQTSNDIQKFKKKRKSENLFRKTLIFLFIAILAFGLYFTTKYIDETPTNKKAINSEQDLNKSYEFPINLVGDDIQKISHISNSLTVLTDKKIYTYTEKGKEIFNKSHNFANPVLVNSIKKNLVYDLNESSYFITNKEKVVFEGKSDFPILLMKLSDEGYVALVSKDSRYAGKLTIFDSNNQEIFTWTSTDLQISHIEFLNGSKGCIIATTGTKNGMIVSEIIQLKFDTPKETAVYDILGSLVTSIKIKNGGNISAVCDNKLVVLDSKLKLIKQTEYENEFYLFSNFSDKYTLLCFRDVTINGYRLNMFDKDGKMIATKELHEQPRFIKNDNSRVLVIAENKIMDYDIMLKNINSFVIDNDVKKLEIIGLNIYAATASTIEKIEID